MSNTQEMPVVPAAVAAPAENMPIPLSPSVKGRFAVVASVEMDRIRSDAIRDLDEAKTAYEQRVKDIRTQEAADLATWEQIAAFVEREVPNPLRVGHAPYIDGSLSEAQEKALAGYVGRPLRNDDSEGRS